MANGWVDGQVMNNLMDRFVDGKQMGGRTSDGQFDGQILGEWTTSGNTYVPT